MNKAEMVRQVEEIWKNADPDFRRLMLREMDRVFNQPKAEAQRVNAFFEAVKNGNIIAVKKILETGMDVNQQDAELGNTALIHAVVNDKYDMVKLLLLNGADPEIRNNRGRNAIDAGKLMGNVEINKLIKLNQ